MAVILKNLSSDEKVAYLYKPILIVLQEAGGKLDRSANCRICRSSKNI